MATWTCENGHENPSTELTKCLDCGARRARTSLIGSGPPRPAQDLRGTITTLWLVAVGVILVSTFVVAVAWPDPMEACLVLEGGGTECGPGDDSGSAFLAFVGGVGLAIGSVVMLVAAVAEGVRLGILSTGLGRE